MDHAQLTERRTQLGDGDGGLHTVEHVLAAIVGAGIDDIVIEMSSAEPPILDGSARPFLDALRGTGVVEHGGTADELRSSREDARGGRRVRVRGAPRRRAVDLDVSIDFPHPLVGAQKGRWAVTEETFALGARGRADVRVRERGGDAAQQGAHPGRVGGEHAGARRARRGGEHASLAGRVRAAQGARRDGRPRAGGPPREGADFGRETQSSGNRDIRARACSRTATGRKA